LLGQGRAGRSHPQGRRAGRDHDETEAKGDHRSFRLFFLFLVFDFIFFFFFFFLV